MPPLNIALISSYSTHGIWQGQKFHDFIRTAGVLDQAGRCPTVLPDIYFFMESDVSYWRSIFGNSQKEKMSAISFLGSLNKSQIDQIVAGTLDNLNRIQPVAITTFFPEISVRNDDPRSQVIEKAIANLMRLAVGIGAASNSIGSSRTPVVQMVAGNRLESIEHRYSPGRERDEFLIKDSFETDAYQRILARLSRSLQLLRRDSKESKNQQQAFDQLKIAFELEPGPLYLLDGPESVKRFCRLIDIGGDTGCDLVRSKVGFNLDIAHWWLKGIEPSYLDDNPNVAERVFHSHIAGHSKRAHFGDISLTEMSTSDEPKITAWLEKVSTLSSPSFSGCVSLEFEAAPNPEIVAQSLQRLVDFVEKLEPQTL